MRNVSLAFVAVAALMSLGTTVAEAGITCKVIPSWCPADDHKSSLRQYSKGNEREPVRTSVPEPASLLLLGAGVSAVGAAIARRRKNNKDR